MKLDNIKDGQVTMTFSHDDLYALVKAMDMVSGSDGAFEGVYQWQVFDAMGAAFLAAAVASDMHGRVINTKDLTLARLHSEHDGPLMGIAAD